MGTNPDRSQMKWYIGDILDNEEDSWNVPGNFENRLPFDPTYLQERPSSAPPIFVADQNVCLLSLFLSQVDTITLFCLFTLTDIVVDSS